jgi:hypothetical protein
MIFVYENPSCCILANAELALRNCYAVWLMVSNEVCEWSTLAGMLAIGFRWVKRDK